MFTGLIEKKGEVLANPKTDCGTIEFDYLTRIVAHQLQIAGKLNYEVKS